VTPNRNRLRLKGAITEAGWIITPCQLPARAGILLVYREMPKKERFDYRFILMSQQNVPHPKFQGNFRPFQIQLKI
jgi:hypothetical protein